ncbi:hypothetical protein [Acrocarpospora sp. B8E8]|uniref:hypothetical protein n=1 Tax=Acrocarpospora sp. B8E8 TaxID=3153572 RepID=UPI00325C7EBE
MAAVNDALDGDGGTNYNNGGSGADSCKSDRDGNLEVYAMNANGTSQINLTNNAAHDFQPDWVIAPTPPCTIIGTAAADTPSGTPGDDVICGLGGNDRLNRRGLPRAWREPSFVSEIRQMFHTQCSHSTPHGSELPQ